MRNFIYKIQSHISFTDVLFAAFFAFVFIGGYVLNIYPEIDAIAPSKKKYVLYFITFLIYFVVSLCVIKFLHKKSIDTKPVKSKSKLLYQFSDKKFFALTSIAIFTCYLPLILASFSILTPDSWSSIRQAIGIDPLTNMHPLIFTIFISGFVNFGIFIGNINVGLLLFSITQSIIFACILAYTLTWLRNFGVSKNFLIFCFIFYAIFPLNSFMGMVMWKDILFAGFGLILITLAIDLFNNKKNNSRQYFIMFTLFAFLFCTWRLNGIYTYLLFVVLLVILNYKRIFSKRLISLLLLPVGIYILYSVIVSIVVSPTHSPAPYVVPLQQISRTVKFNGHLLTQQERKTISEVLDYDKLGAAYNQNLADPIFRLFDYDSFAKNKVKYFKLWINLGLKYPKTYLSAFTYNNYRYFYPYFVAPSTYNIVDSNAVQSKALQNYRDISFERGHKRGAAEYHNTSYAILPMLYSIGIYTLSLVLCLYISIKKKLLGMAAPFILLISLILTTMLGPVNGELRYLYLFVIATPLVFGYTFYAKMINRKKSIK